MAGRERDRERTEDKEFTEKLIRLNRVSKAIKGGRKMSFSALMVVGDGKGRVGYGFGKANDVSEAIRKSVDRAKQNMIAVPIKKNTLPHEILGKFKSASVLLRPAAPGTGIIAGGPVRAIMEAAGVSDVLAKSLGSKNTINVVKGVFNAFDNILLAPKVASGRGKNIKDMWG
jgi:small subunit ribosomal protein S5